MKLAIESAKVRVYREISSYTKCLADCRGFYNLIEQIIAAFSSFFIPPESSFIYPCLFP